MNYYVIQRADDSIGVLITDDQLFEGELDQMTKYVALKEVNPDFTAGKTHYDRKSPYARASELLDTLLDYDNNLLERVHRLCAAFFNAGREIERAETEVKVKDLQEEVRKLKSQLSESYSVPEIEGDTIGL